MPQVLSGPELSGKGRLRLQDDEWDVPSRMVSWSEELGIVAALAGLGLVVLLLI